MTLYNLVLFVHIFATLVLFMAVAIELVALHRVRGATTSDELRDRASMIKLTDKPLPIGTVGILISGLYMVWTAWDVTVPWVGLSLGVVAVMFTVGPAVNSRRLDAIAAAAVTTPPGSIPASLASRIQDPVLLAGVHTLAALAFGVVFLKVARPDLAGGLAVLAVAVVLGVLSARLASRGRAAPAEVTAMPVRVADERP
jgi:hypothetical protein